jgi:hypothetical protein
LAADRKIPLIAMRADIRFWTAIILIGICAFSLVRGLSIVRFSHAMATIDSTERQAETIRLWARVPGVGATALQTKLTEKINTSDLQTANSRRETLAAILSVEPLSSLNWLSLSRMYLITDQPMEQVSGALMLSMVTGPNEGYVMGERGIFGVSLWEDLSPDLRRHVGMDLADEEILKNGKFRDVLSTKSEGVRSEVRSAMLATGLALKEVERRLGL